VKPQSIRKELVAHAQQTISSPGFKVDTLKLAESLVTVIAPALFGQARYKINSGCAAPEDAQSSKSRPVASSESLNESGKRETP
jgi:hypothetical protein